MVDQDQDVDSSAAALADFSVCVDTDGGPVYVAEFRTYAEAIVIAQQTQVKWESRVAVRHDGVDIRVFYPQAKVER